MTQTVLLVGSLCAVEEVHRLLLVCIGGGKVTTVGIRLGVSDSGLLAIATYTYAVPHRELEVVRG